MEPHKCIFCSQKSGKLNTFSETTLERCNKTLTFRKEHGLSMHSITLPKTVIEDCDQGYHSKCYQKFTALPPKHRPKAVVKTIAGIDTSAPMHEDASISKLSAQTSDTENTSADTK